MAKLLSVIVKILSYHFIFSYAMQEVSTELQLPDLVNVETDVRLFYSSLTSEEKAQLNEIADRVENGSLKFSLSEPNFVEDVKALSGDLALKLLGLRDAINSKLEDFQPESRQFIETIISKFIGIFAEGGVMNIFGNMKKFGVDIMKTYDSLSQSAQEDILRGFPTLGSLATSDIVRLIVSKLSDYKPSAKNVGSTTLQPNIDEQTNTPTHSDNDNTLTTSFPKIYPYITTAEPIEDIEEPIRKEIKIHR